MPAGGKSGAVRVMKRFLQSGAFQGGVNHQKGMPGTQCPEQGGAFKEPRANGFQEAADCQVKGLPVHPLSFFWGKVADEGIWPDSNRGSCSSGKQPPPPARRVCLHKSTRFFHTPLAAAGRQGGHQRDAMSSRIYCRGLRRAEEGGDDEGPERLGAPYSSGTSAARDTSSGRLLSS